MGLGYLDSFSVSVLSKVGPMAYLAETILFLVLFSYLVSNHHELATTRHVVYNLGWNESISSSLARRPDHGFQSQISLQPSYV
jgi:hypothetical protein